MGRFFATDPLEKKYPYYTPYQFSGNKVIHAIELEGLEEIVLSDVNPSTETTAGSAKIDINMDYKYVNSGPGTLTKTPSSSDFASNMSKGDISLRVYNLPSSTAEMVTLTGQHSRWAEKAEKGSQKHKDKLIAAGVAYYNVDVKYNFTVSPGGGILDVYNWTFENVNRRGMLADNFSNQEQVQLQSSLFSYNSFMHEGKDSSFESLLFSFNRVTRGAFKLDSNIGGAGYNSTLNAKFGIAKIGLADFNLIFISTNYNNLSDTERVLHEVGHNLSAKNIHGTGVYEYNQTGLQSNQKNKVYPTESNTINIINDEHNRSNIIINNN